MPQNDFILDKKQSEQAVLAFYETVIRELKVKNPPFAARFRKILLDSVRKSDFDAENACMALAEDYPELHKSPTFSTMMPMRDEDWGERQEKVLQLAMMHSLLGSNSTSSGRIHCAVCNTSLEIMKRCGRCKEKIYCGEACQRADWKTHKSVCKESPTEKE